MDEEAERIALFISHVNDTPVLPFLRRHALGFILGACTAVTVVPLWVVRHLPAVDVPQHLFLIHVLGHLSEPGSPYRDIYVARPGLTYLTFYYSVRALASLLGVEIALKVWLTLVLGGIPLSLLALLRALGRSPWLALLACPLVYTDNFYWGLISFQSSIPLTLLLLAFFVRALELPWTDPGAPRALFGSAASLVALQLTHAAGMTFPALALPLLALTTPSDNRRRLRALLALVPGALLFLAWLLIGVQKGRQHGMPGEPWKSSAGLLHGESYLFDGLEVRLGRFTELLANGFWSYADRPILWAVAVTALGTLLFAAWRPPEALASPLLARLRPVLLLGLGIAFYLFLPRDITGYMYAVYPRYAQVAALLAIPVLAFPRGPSSKLVVGAAVATALFAGIQLTRLFPRVDGEADAFETVIKRLPPHARIQHLVIDWSSRWATHAVFLHYAALAALRVDGVPSFSLAIDPSFPVGYRDGAKPPASPWEWRPQALAWDQALWYDCHLLRGDLPLDKVFGDHAKDLELVSSADRWKLLCRTR